MDEVQVWQPRYERDCWRCEAGLHVCYGCRVPVDHDGREVGLDNPRRGEVHGTRCVD